jgi:hypothetical protein
LSREAFDGDIELLRFLFDFDGSMESLGLAGVEEGRRAFNVKEGPPLFTNEGSVDEKPILLVIFD